MKVDYFEDTDTLYLVLSEQEPVETKEISENILVDVDQTGKVVSLTIEHARQQEESFDISYRLVGAK